jgi:hypothetical protein
MMADIDRGETGDNVFRSVDDDEEVFRVTTQNEFDGMMNEYRFRKGKRTLPSTSSGKEGGGDSPAAGKAAIRTNPFLAKPKNRWGMLLKHMI